ncbi:S-layer homology domain-containing protein [uncultured Megasphaera sp.]|uniref:S-layer homology domain-containing protein n=1 Tax=Megasphaera massiliensis TaxID=1232428 RepID=UPI00266D6208|nr:S-layer homology domain-containing protein [uncultured Megasphaera sp.]
MVRHKIAAFLAAAMLLSASPAFADAPYTDLGSMADRQAVDYLYDTQCLTFITGNSFEPNRVLTRGELAQLLYNVAGNIPLVQPGAPALKDVSQGTAGDAMNAVAAQGILTGYQDGNFQPEASVSREEFADVIYRYLQYSRMADPDQEVTPYADEAQVSPAYAQAVAVLHSKNIMVPADGYFRPKEGMTRADAAQVFYRFMHSDGDYTSHVQIETQVMKAINAEYGSVLAYFQRGTMYWDNDVLVLGIKGSPSKYLTKRIKDDVSKSEAVQIRRVSLSHADYSQLMNRAIHTIVDKEGVQNYVGAVPDYVHEQIVVTVRHPVSKDTLAELASRVGAGRVRLETMVPAGQTAVVQVPGVDASNETTKAEPSGQIVNRRLYAAALDDTTSSAVTSVQNDAMN